MCTHLSINIFQSFFKHFKPKSSRLLLL